MMRRKTSVSKRRAVAARKKQWAAAGRCQSCGAEPRPGRKTCVHCAEQQSTAIKRLRAERIAKGLCPQCGKRPPAEGRTKCQGCLDQVARLTRRYRVKKAAS